MGISVLVPSFKYLLLLFSATFGVGQAMPPIQTFQIGKASASEIYRVIDEEKPLIEAPITPTTSNSSNSATLVASSSSSKLSTTTGVFSTLAFHDVCFTYPTRPEVQVVHNWHTHLLQHLLQHHLPLYRFLPTFLFILLLE